MTLSLEHDSSSLVNSIHVSTLGRSDYEELPNIPHLISELLEMTMKHISLYKKKEMLENRHHYTNKLTCFHCLKFWMFIIWFIIWLCLNYVQYLFCIYFTSVMAAYDSEIAAEVEVSEWNKFVELE